MELQDWAAVGGMVLANVGSEKRLQQHVAAKMKNFAQREAEVGPAFKVFRRVNRVLTGSALISATGNPLAGLFVSEGLTRSVRAHSGAAVKYTGRMLGFACLGGEVAGGLGYLTLKAFDKA